MKILVTGSNGQLGRELQRYGKEYPQYSFLFTDIGELDITDKKAIEAFFGIHKPEVVINCAAYTAVDKAETDVERALQLNGEATGALARAASGLDSLFFQVSTDYIFNGKKNTPYSEEDTADPVSVYAISKFQGEQETTTCSTRGIIIRTSWLYSEYNANFVRTILTKGKERGELNVVFDQTGSPTWAADLARAILEMIPSLKDHRGVEVFHYSNEGVATWYDFAKAIVELSGIRCRINPIFTEEYLLPAARPVYSVMSKAKFRKRFGIAVPYWRDSLKECISKMIDV